MIVDINIEYFLDCFFYILDSWITKFLDFSRICENNVVVLAIKIRLFVLGLIFPKLVFSN